MSAAVPKLQVGKKSYYKKLQTFSLSQNLSCKLVECLDIKFQHTRQRASTQTGGRGCTPPGPAQKLCNVAPASSLVPASKAMYVNYFVRWHANFSFFVLQRLHSFFGTARFTGVAFWLQHLVGQQHLRGRRKHWLMQAMLVSL